MKPQTLRAIRSVLQMDPYLTPADIRRILLVLHAPKGKPPILDRTAPPPRLLKRHDVARMLGRSVRMVDRLAQEGTIRKFTLPGRERSAGFLESEIVALINSSTQVNSGE